MNIVSSEALSCPGLSPSLSHIFLYTTEQPRPRASDAMSSVFPQNRSQHNQGLWTELSDTVSQNKSCLPLNCSLGYFDQAIER